MAKIWFLSPTRLLVNAEPLAVRRPLRAARRLVAARQLQRPARRGVGQPDLRDERVLLEVRLVDGVGDPLAVGRDLRAADGLESADRRRSGTFCGLLSQLRDERRGDQKREGDDKAGRYRMRACYPTKEASSFLLPASRSHFSSGLELITES